jgi:hypothetical protein
MFSFSETSEVCSEQSLLSSNFVFTSENGVFASRVSTETPAECSYHVEPQTVENYCIESQLPAEARTYRINSVHQLEHSTENYQLDRNATPPSDNTYYIESTCEDGSQAVGYQYVSDETYRMEAGAVDGSAELYHIVEPNQGHSYELESGELEANQTVSDVNAGNPSGLVIHCVEYVDSNDDRNAVGVIEEQSQVFTQSDLEMTVEEHASSVPESANAEDPVNGQTGAVIVGIPASESQTTAVRPFIVLPSALLEGLQNQQILMTAGKTGQTAGSSQVVYQLANASTLVQAPIQLKCVGGASG